MDALNALLTTCADGVLLLLSPFSPLAALVVLSAVTGVLMTIGFRYTSNQAALRRVADMTRANLLAVRLFRDDLGVTLRAQGALLAATGLRLWHSLRPMAVMILPFFFVLTQLAQYYEFRPPRPNEAIHVSIELTPVAFEAWAAGAKLDVPEGVRVTAGPLRQASRLRMDWRLSAERPLSGALRWRCGDATVEKRLVVSADAAALLRVNPIRPGANLWERLLYPAEAALPDGGAVKRIAIQVEPRSTPVFGWEVPWWATYLVLSIVFALLARPFLGVQF